ncbi:hypothetical protein [Hugenholtzia roseola]|uniref:hypothetical protein n=1 Tax=Hugenholtzia roseola TaxID=1002 RepID=UPI0012B58D34|nr:hypothetical protein [Hugenholtzia roseola]
MYFLFKKNALVLSFLMLSLILGLSSCTAKVESTTDEAQSKALQVDSTEAQAANGETAEEVVEEPYDDDAPRIDEDQLKLLQGAWETGDPDAPEDSENGWYGFTISGTEWNDRAYAESEMGPAQISFAGDMLLCTHSVYGVQKRRIIKLTKDEFIFQIVNEDGSTYPQTVCRRQKN